MKLTKMRVEIDNINMRKLQSNLRNMVGMKNLPSTTLPIIKTITTIVIINEDMVNSSSLPWEKTTGIFLSIMDPLPSTTLMVHLMG